jgi:hypothetical protein
MTSVWERRRTVILEPELMDSLDLIQGKVTDFDVDYKIKTNSAWAYGGCDCTACSDMCSDGCTTDCGDTLGF